MQSGRILRPVWNYHQSLAWADTVRRSRQFAMQKRPWGRDSFQTVHSQVINNDTAALASMLMRMTASKASIRTAIRHIHI